MRTKIKNVLSGKTVDKTFNAGLKIETATVDRRDMTYLYQDGTDYVFMDQSTYEQINVPAETVGDARNFMVENQDVIVSQHDGTVLFVELPATVVLTITHTEPRPAGRSLLRRHQACDPRDRLRDSGSPLHGGRHPRQG